MKKRKIRFWLNIVTICLSVCAIAIGVYSLTTASLKVSGSIGFTVHDCKLSISAYMYGHSLSANGKAVAENDKTYLINSKDGTTATESNPMIVVDNTGALSFNINDDTYKGVYFSNLNSTGKPTDIKIVITATNISKDVVYFEDNTSNTSSSLSVSCDKSICVFYTEKQYNTYTITYTIKATPNSSGEYTSITTPLDVELSMNFSKLDTNISKDGFTIDGSSITGVPAKTDSDMIVIPSTFSDGTTVTKLAAPSGSYHWDNIDQYKKIIILNGISDLGQELFANCSNSSIHLPNDLVKIPNYTFQGCSNNLNIIIPDGVTEIGDNAFYFSTKLTSINLPQSINIIGVSAFDGCSSLVSIEIPNNVIEIKTSAFSSCDKLESVILPKSLNKIGGLAFAYCESLESIVIPYGTTEISNSFSSCSKLTNVEIPSSINNLNSFAFESTAFLTNLQNNNNGIYTCSDGRKIMIKAPTNVTSINLTGCYYIAEQAFANCTSLTTIIIPSGITKLETKVLNGCSSLTALTLPDTIDSISWYALTGCTKLKSVTYLGTKEQWNNIDISSSSDFSGKTIICTDGTISL